MYMDSARSGGGTMALTTGPPLALYDLIGKKTSPVSYAYSCDMSIVGEEEKHADDDEDDKHGRRDERRAEGPSRTPSGRSSSSNAARGWRPPQTEQPTDHQLQHPSANPILEDSASPSTPPPPQTTTPPTQPPPHPQPSATTTTTTTRPHIAPRGETYPQQSSPPKRPSDWQTIRYMTSPGRVQKAQLEAWVGGWSAAVGELGDETYCACADSAAASLAYASSSLSASEKSHGRHGVESSHSSQSSPLTREASAASSSPSSKRRHKHNNHKQQIPAIETVESAPASSATGKRGRRTTGQGDDGEETEAASALCRTCSRRPSPAVVPDPEFVLPPMSGAGKVALRCKLAWRRIVDRASARSGQQSQSPGPGGLSTPPVPPASAAVQPPMVGGVSQRQEDNIEEDEIDLDDLSASSSGEGARRPLRAADAIAERQARLRRAQRLLAKQKQKAEA